MALEVTRSIEQWIECFGPSRKSTALAIGNFDGMHRGHREILRRVVERAKAAGRAAAVLTFYPHPAQVLRPAQAPSLLMTLDQRLEAFDAIGINATLVMRFDARLAEMSARDFVERVLVQTMRPQAVLVGGDFRFGHKQLGDVRLLQEVGQQSSFQVEIVPPVFQGGLVISSTAIRSALIEGRVEDAERMLGRPFSLSGEIQSGTGLGRKVVVPTLNLKTAQETLPQKGVYATLTVMNGEEYRSVTNVGMRPTFNGSHITIESHLLDFNENRTSGGMEVRFLRRLREEKKFSAPEELRAQVTKDIQDARSFFLQLEKANP
jgi:riboflavin kinase/FMN adenylyltransferase